MNISDAARLSALPAKTIRFYEDQGLISPKRQASNGYREYCERDVHLLRFLQRSRSLGFSLQDCRELLALYSDQKRASADVKRLALARITEIDEKIEALNEMRDVLGTLARKCHGDARPDCPILERLAAREPIRPDRL